MKLPDYAKAIGISYTTAWRWWKANKLPHPARQTESGLIIVDYSPQAPSNKAKKNRVAIYSRVSSSENKDNLNRQSERLTEYAIANGYQIVRNVKEIGSGLNDRRKQLETLLQQNDYDILLVENKDRLAQFGTNYLDVLLLRLGVKLEIVNLADNGKDELMEDLVAVVTSLAARLYGQRRASRKTEKIIAELRNPD
ncbi:MAG TPA: IS607 family transposase [Cyanobacteria bacterium UBA11149]|nr:IS607 family transposase [Cyanobacteria bacterium UBA11367]HBE58784.1 IS607 family transposase [Cyanobacteria bacterium UBA11366]HBK66314.1 IS607 family transposase [Cyanobacteria bacterium UBA11166]HBR77132.1 IS607 family transposase [Cyanobacteria bacterium UBA11159]HBS67620.1 IS607 family transposase [Cyanobacteria bacterium UBA11153]HBW87650.1 IS607 family transposase [Cyanobacteria bacterium UBA11149]HCA95148.1 IS607 family transposase [Cyanobacteria bacterium UBA9226]